MNLYFWQLKPHPTELLKIRNKADIQAIFDELLTYLFLLIYAELSFFLSYLKWESVGQRWQNTVTIIAPVVQACASNIGWLINQSQEIKILRSTNLWHAWVESDRVEPLGLVSKK